VRIAAGQRTGLLEELQTIGFDTSRRDTGGHPVVVRPHYDRPHAGAPHVLFYGHYDVQPVDPLAVCEGDPFAPEIRERAGHKVICARGASDDKKRQLDDLYRSLACL